VSEEKKRKDHKQAVRGMIESIEKNLDTKKATLGHYIRLLQLERELEAEHPSDIQVKWVDSENESENSDQ
jgi:hypothetical protein